MARRPRDSQRSKLYAAEQVIRGKHYDQSFADLDETAAFVKKVLESKWVRKKWDVPVNHFNRIRIKDGRGTRTARGGKYLLNLPVWSRNKAVVLHEMAHMIESIFHTRSGLFRFLVPAHGREFAKIYLELVRHFMGREAYDDLRASFKAHRVKYSKQKSLSREARERLRQRGLQLAAARKKETE